METPPPNQPQGPQDPQPSVPPAPGTPDPMAYAAYPRPNAGPTIRFDVIGTAFNMVFKDLGTWAVAALALVVPALVFSLLIWVVLIPALGGVGGVIISLVMMAIMMLGLIAITQAMMANMYRMAAIALSGRKPEVGEMFKFGNNIGSILVCALLVGLAVAIGSIFCYIPGLIAGGLLMFALPALVDKRLAPMDAINMSINMLKKDWLMATLFFIVISVCAQIGGVLCGIGAVLTFPVMPIAIMMLYRDYVGNFTYAAEPVR